MDSGARRDLARGNCPGRVEESPEFSTWRLVLGFVFFAEAIWVRSFGIDLTRESAIVRGVRRRTIPGVRSGQCSATASSGQGG